MVRLAIHAGLPQNLDLIHEPEAAAIFCFVEEMGNSLRSASTSSSRDGTPDVRSASKVKESSPRSPLVASDAPQKMTEAYSSPAIRIHHGC